jgi:preprotein translocase subunit YajC
MKDEMLLKISLATACMGIFALFIIMQSEKEIVYTLEEIDGLKENEEIVVYGIIDGIRESNEAINIEITEIKKIKKNALYFKDDSRINLKEGDYVKIKWTKYGDGIIVDTISIQ